MKSAIVDPVRFEESVREFRKALRVALGRAFPDTSDVRLIEFAALSVEQHLGPRKMARLAERCDRNFDDEKLLRLVFNLVPASEAERRGHWVRIGEVLTARLGVRR